MADNTNCSIRTEFNIKLNETIKRGLVSMYLRKPETQSFVVYRKLSAYYIATLKYSTLEKGKMMYHMRLSFTINSADFDGKYIMIVQSLDVNLYDWQLKMFSKYSIRNSALILKVVRLISMINTAMADAELYKLLVAPYSSNMPLKYSAPQLFKENAFLSNIYFDELLLCMVADKKLSLTLHRFDKKNGKYYLYPGTVNGLAKLPETSVDYNKPNNLDLTAMPQEVLKYKLITSHHTRDDDISKYHNVVTLRHELRRMILGAGMCDVRIEILLTSQAMNQFKQNTPSGDIEINAGNAELFYASIATRIVDLMSHELNRPGNTGLVNLNETLSHNPFRRNSVNLMRDFKEASRKGCGAYNNRHESQSDAFIEEIFKEFQKKDSSLMSRHAPPQASKKLVGVKELVGETQFVYKLLRMKVASLQNSRASTFMSTRPTTAPRMFKDAETAMFKISIFPTKSRTAMHNLILSSADISAMFNIVDFFVEGMSISRIDVKTIAWISGLDAKVIFNYFCTFITNRIMMKRWILFKRPFVFYSKDVSRRMYLHQNDVVYTDQKITPKILPFLHVQALDYDYVYHRVVRHQSTYLTISLIQKVKDKIYTLRVYSQHTCRAYTCNFKSADLTDSVENFLCGVMHQVLTTSITQLPRTLGQLLTSITRVIPKNTKINENLPDISLSSHQASHLVVEHLQAVIEDKFVREKSHSFRTSTVNNDIKQIKQMTGSNLISNQFYNQNNYYPLSCMAKKILSRLLSESRISSE